MILVYPMLTSESVNPTLLPGIIKAVEKYIIVNNTDDVLGYLNNAIGDVMKVTVGGIASAAATVGIAAAVAKAKEKGLPGATLRKVGKNIELKEQKSIKPPAKTPVEKSADQTSKDISQAARGASIKGFEMARQDAVSLEPTWLQVQTSMGAKLIGVKVIPYKVKSTTGMVGLLMNDAELKKMDYMSTKMARVATRVLFRALRGLRIPGFKDKAISGDPKKDIVLAKSQFGKNAFVCFSKLDIEKDDVFTSPQAVQRLHKLGWASLIVTDDVNKQATFCMKQFGGVCSTIPYSFIFASLGKEHAQVYKDLEDAARSAGPFFRRKGTTKRKLFSK